MKLLSFSAAVGSAFVFAACAGSGGDRPDDFGYNGTGIEFKVSPLTLETLDDACYSFAVVSQLSQLVVGRGPSVTQTNLPGVSGVPGTVTAALCASRFGNAGGGDISYVAPCDASENAKNHTVHLWVNALCVDGGATANIGQDCTQIQDYVNPCPTVGGCSLQVTCIENADVPVVFNFTIMGQADQGFFDIAVNFSDIFCSAKLDTCYGDTPITLLFDMNETIPTGEMVTCVFDNGCNSDGTEFNPTNAVPPVLWGETCPGGTNCSSDPGCHLDCSAFKPAYSNGDDVPLQAPNPNFRKRINTAVLALACTAGANTASGTYLHMGDVEVICDNALFATLDLSTIQQEGNQEPVNGITWAVYYGSESLMTQDQTPVPWNKEYFNVAVAGFGENCALSWKATASEGPTLGTATSEGFNTYNSYPVINYNDTVTDIAGAWVCSQNPVNVPGSGVNTDYVPCTTPGECLQGDCTTTQGGVLYDCEAGAPPECPKGGITLLLTGIQDDGEGNQTPVTFAIFLTDGGGTLPTYSVTFQTGETEELTFTASQTGGTWTIHASDGLDSIVFATNATLTGTWTMVDETFGITDLVVTCGMLAENACGEAGVTVTLGATDVDESFTFELYLPNSGDAEFGMPVYSQDLVFSGSGAASTFTIQSMGYAWAFFTAQNNVTNFIGSNPVLLGTWANVNPDDEGDISTMTVTCGGEANYACIQWTSGLEGDLGQAYDLIPFSSTDNGVQAVGWSFGDGAGIIRDPTGGPWTVRPGDSYVLETTVDGQDEPWGSYVVPYTGGDPDYSGAPVLYVTISAGLCDFTPPSPDPIDSTTVFTTRAGTPGYAHHVATGAAPTAAWTVMNDGSPAAYPEEWSQVDAIDFRDGSTSNLIVFSNHYRGDAPLEMGVFQNAVANPAGGPHTMLTTGGNWPVVGNILPFELKSPLLIASGVVLDSLGGMNMIAMQAGSFDGGPDAFHFFRLRLYLSGAAIVVAHLGSFAPAETGALEAWNGAAPYKSRIMAVRQTETGEAEVALMGAYMLPGQTDDVSYLHGFSVNLAAGTVVHTGSPVLPDNGRISFAGWQGTDHLAVVFVDNGTTPTTHLGFLKRADAALTTIPTGLPTGGGSPLFSAYAEPTGLMFGFWQDVSRLAYHALGTDPTSPNGGFNPLNFFPDTFKFHGVAYQDYVHPN